MAPKRMERQPNPNDAIGCYALEACAHNPDVLIIDVREERDDGYIQNSWWRPLNTFDAAELLEDIEAELPGTIRRLVIYCDHTMQRSPVASREVVEELRKQNFESTIKEVELLVGGFDAWVENDLPRCFDEQDGSGQKDEDRVEGGE